MATISIAGIQQVSNTRLERYIANVAIVAGEAIYLDADNEANLTLNTDAARDDIAGIAFQDADIGNYVISIPTGAVIQVSNTLVVTDVYVLAAVAGDVMLASDLLATHYLTEIGTATATDQLTLNFNTTSKIKA
jgi:hypothetical protein